MKLAPVYFVPTRDRTVALTFDDGPTPGVTDRILDFLEKHSAKATFFMLGCQVEKHPDLARRVVDCGHEVAIHSYTHKHGMNEWSVADLKQTFQKTSDIIEATTGVRPKLIRPPYGNVGPAILQTCDEMGLLFAGWSLSVSDWIGKPGGKVETLRDMSIPGSVVLLHDGHRVGPEKVPFSLTLLACLFAKKDMKVESMSSLNARWDDSLTSMVDGNKLLGFASRHIVKDRAMEAVGFWSTPDLMNGISYEVYCPNSEPSRLSIHIPPLSNVDPWCQKVRFPVSCQSDVCVVSSGRCQL